MSTNTAVRLSAEEERQLNIVFSPLRPDLIFQRQIFKGEAYYIIKDPLALTYFRLQPEEAYLLQLLDGQKTLKAIIAEFKAEFPNAERSPQEISSFCNQLGRSGLLNIAARSFVDFARQKPKAFNSLFMLWVKLISKILFFKIPLLDPSPWLGKMVHSIRFAWHPYFVWSCIAFYTFTLGWVFGHWGEVQLYVDKVSFFSPESIGLIWLAMLLIKTCHEFGHATTCRRFGGEVHEMGICFICMMFCGYVDASDGWMMRKKSHKIYTTIAGVFVEFMLASLAAYLWFNVSSGVFRDLMFRAMVIASFNTVVFNMNPLMKFDGYYVIADLLEIPNLRTKAITYCSYHMQRLLFGYSNTMQERLLEGESRQGVFIIYAVSAYFYMAGVIYGLSQIFARMLEKYELKEFGLILGIAAQLSFLLSPIIKIIYDGLKPGAHIVMLEPVWKRLSKWGFGLTVIGVFMLVWPVYYKVEAQGIVVADDYAVVTTVTPGFLDTVVVNTGDRVMAGAMLGRLRNLEVETQLRIAEANLQLARLRMGDAEYRPEVGYGAESMLGYESAYIGYNEAKRKADDLILKSPHDGIVMTQEIGRLQGKFFDTEAAVFEVADTAQLKVIVPITEEQVTLLTLGGDVKARVLGTGELITSSLAFVAEQKAVPTEYLHAMLEAFGGPVKPRIDYQGGAGQTGSFFAEAFIEKVPQGLQPYMRVNATITGARTTIAEKLWRKFLNFWNLRGPVKNPFSQGSFS